MIETTSRAAALRPPRFCPFGWRLRTIARPYGIGSAGLGWLPGSAGRVTLGDGRPVVYVKRGRAVLWLEWRPAPDPLLPGLEAVY